MGNFDVTTPAGSDLLSQGDDKIREFKLAMREALRAGEVAGDDIEGVEAIFPGSAPSTTPVYRYRGLKGTTAERPTAGQYGLYLDSTRGVMQRDNGVGWDDVFSIQDNSITTNKITDLNVTTDKLAANAVTEPSLTGSTGRTAGTSLLTKTIAIPAGAKTLVTACGFIGFTIPSTFLEFYIQVTNASGALDGNYTLGRCFGSAGATWIIPFNVSFLDSTSTGSTTYTASYTAIHSPANFVSASTLCNINTIILKK